MEIRTKEQWKVLFSKIAEGDMSAYLTVFNTYHPTIFSTALQYCKLRHLADDAAQQVFVELWEKREKLIHVEDPEAWLWTVARNQTLKILKKESTQKHYVEFIKEYFSNEEHTPINQLIFKQKSILVDDLVKSMPTRQQEVYKLSRNEGLTYAQISEKLGIGTETVKEHISKALRVIRMAIQKHENGLKILFFIFFLLHTPQLYSLTYIYTIRLF